jgi:hypothetical protein
MVLARETHIHTLSYEKSRTALSVERCVAKEVPASGNQGRSRSSALTSKINLNPSKPHSKLHAHLPFQPFGNFELLLKRKVPIFTMISTAAH